jgi:hypothetical protein
MEPHLNQLAGKLVDTSGPKKEARLLGVWPLATERDGGLSGSRCPVGAVLKEAAREAASQFILELSAGWKNLTRCKRR